ncbi:HAMP domain-containing sensor histidine kinase [Clostridium boliviensis]|uniref:histidine kinase n=1 Tax=Clostridium boliviensis TaxID=318465 RepID=A0ABU4GMJ4_9CLOT|nr:HAMP domain-containing sensor histidine kinase [Clostridium boliviensis]MDW2798826.1 HAMP domain-containing sensor histidine kinase [Clostridium boliviensis]
MIKKLRTRFILINMGFVISILAAVLGVFYMANRQRIVRNTSIALFQSMNHERFKIPPDKVEFGRRPKQNPIPLTPVFVITLNEDQTIENIDENNITVTNELASSLIRLVNASGSREGILKDYSLRYLKISSRNGTKIGFADQSYERNSLETLLFNCLLIFLCTVILFFLLSLFLSRLALKPAEQAWDQQNQFITDASHELKTPITVILANLQILLSHKERTIKEQEKWIINTKEEADRMKQLVEELLFLARSDAQTMESVTSLRQTLNFSELVLNCVLLFESVAYENKVALENELESDIVLEGIEVQLKQLITILLDNACKYAGKSGTVSVVLKKTAGHAVFIITNSGNPILPEEQKHVFKRFYRTDQSRARKEGGYGLGLSIAQTIVDRHRGSISVTSSAENGTTFTITLPALLHSS